MVSGLRTIAWMACIVYSTIPAFWLVIHPYAARWRRLSSPYKVLLPLWFLMWLVVGAISWPWRNVELYDTPWAWLCAGLIFALGVFIYIESLQNFSGNQLGGVPEIVADHRQQHLVTTGIRSRVRHPVYLGHLCEMLAWSIGSGLWINYGLTSFAVITGAVMIRLEDRELETRFGEEFRDYRQRVPSLFPNLPSRS